MDESQKSLILECSRPFVSSRRIQETLGEVQVQLLVREHGVVSFELQPVKTASDRGYDYDRVMQYEKLLD